jgi:Domain of unknown function (DUF5666)
MNRHLSIFVLSLVFLVRVAHSQEVVPKRSPSVAPQPDSADRTDNDSDKLLDPASLLPDLPPLPAARATLIGGILEKLDRVQDQIIVQVFGGGKTTVFFDTRTHIYRDGKPALGSELRPGQRVYVDTILNGSMVFARNISLKTAIPQGENEGVVASYRHDKGELVVRDLISPEPLKLHLRSDTRILKDDQPVAASDLTPGTLIAVQFGGEFDGQVIAERVSILAAQGANFNFAGRVTYLDLRTGLLVLTSATNHQTYEIYLDPSVPIDQDFSEGADVTVIAEFDGNRYVARRLTVNSRPER